VPEAKIMKGIEKLMENTINFYGFSVFSNNHLVTSHKMNYFTNLEEIKSVCNEARQFWVERLGKDIEVLPDYVEYEHDELALMNVNF